MNDIEEVLSAYRSSEQAGDGWETFRLDSIEAPEAELRSRELGQEMEASRLMIQRLIEVSKQYDSPQALLMFSREIARLLDAMANLLFRAQVQNEADSIINRLMEDILGEMNQRPESEQWV
jgi:hypothetical protein